jgi:DNA-binding transcriptional regulator YdaS (Cro superfamily)
MPEKELLKAVKLIGSQQKLADKLGISRKVVNNWLNAGIDIPLKHALQIEVFTNGSIKAVHLNPDNKDVINSYRQYVIQGLK